MRRVPIVVALVLGACLCAAQDLVRVQTPFVAPKRWALVIGASKYEHFGSLQYSADDAASFSKALVDAYGFEASKVRTLTDLDGVANGDKPTVSNIRRELDGILSNRALNKGDLFVFYFAGHGIGTKQGDFLVPSDATKENAERVGLPIRDVISQIVGAGLKNVLVIADACRAGEQNPFGNELQELGKKANIAVLLGCSPGKRSYEYPALGHGIFTYMLEKAMRTEGLREARTGALWASAIAKKVQTDVAAYTERDYGPDKQVPSTWSEASTFDVLVGAYIGKDSIAQMGMKEVLKLQKELNRESFAFYLRALGAFYFSNGRTGDAIESYRTLGQLGMGTPDDQLALAGCLMAEGRDGEATKIYQEIVQTNAKSIVTDMAFLALGRANGTEQQRRNAARNIWLADRSWIYAYVYWVAIGLYDPVETSEREKVLAELLAHFGAESRQGLYLQASHAYLGVDMPAALDLLTRCSKVPGNEPERNDVLILLYQIADRLGDEALVRKVIGNGQQDARHKEFWDGIQAMRIDKVQPNQREQMIEEMLRANQEPQAILTLTVAAGRSAAALLPKIREAAAKHPFAWQAHLAVWLANEAALGNPYPPSPLSPEMERYGPSNLDVRLEAWQAYAALLDEAKLAHSVRNRFKRYFLRDALRDFERIGTRWDLWEAVEGLFADLWLQLEMGVLAEKAIAPLAKKGSGTVQLREVLLSCYIGAGMFKEADALFRSSKWDGGEARSGDLRWAISLAMRDKDDEAALVLARIGPQKDRSLQEMRESLGLLLEARRGTANLTRLERYRPNNLVAKQLAALALVKARFPKSPEQIGALLPLYDAITPVCISVNEFYRDVHGQCLLALDSMNRFLDRQKPAAQVEDLPVSIAMEHFGSPHYAQLHFGREPGLAQFVGSQTWEGQARADLADSASASIATITVRPDGSATVEMEGAPRFLGKVDAYGNLIATAKVKGKTATLTAKLPPAGHRSKHFADIPPRFLIRTEEGRLMEFISTRTL